MVSAAVVIGKLDLAIEGLGVTGRSIRRRSSRRFEPLRIDAVQRRLRTLLTAGVDVNRKGKRAVAWACGLK